MNTPAYKNPSVTRTHKPIIVEILVRNSCGYTPIINILMNTPAYKNPSVTRTQKPIVEILVRNSCGYTPIIKILMNTNSCACHAPIIKIRIELIFEIHPTLSVVLDSSSMSRALHGSFPLILSFLYQMKWQTLYVYHN